MAKATTPAPSSVVREVLEELEYSGKHSGTPACPFCASFAPLDPANPREWEQHAPDCKLGQALAEVRA